MPATLPSYNMNIARTNKNINVSLMDHTRERVVNTFRGDRVPPVPTKALATINMIREGEIVKSG